MMSNYFIPSNIATVVISTGKARSIVMLPAASTVPGKIINIKTFEFLDTADFYISAARISTVGLDTLEGVSPSTGLSCYGLISTPNACVTLASDGGTNWMVLGNEAGAYPFLSSQYFRPTDINGMRWWFDASDLTTFTLSTNSTIARWFNKAPGFTSTFMRPGINGLLGGTANSQSARLGETSLFGKPTVWFSTTSEMFISSTSLVNNALFIVMRPLTGLDATYPSTQIVGNLALTPPVYNANIVFNTLLNRYEYKAFRFNATPIIPNLFFASSVSPINSPILLSLNCTGTSACNIGTYNGSVMTVLLSNNASFALENCNYFFNSHRYSTSMEVAEVIYYLGTLNSIQRQQMEGYLAWKWGLNYNDLAATHPYKFVTPLS